jgi:hypothetical protein
MSGIGNITLSGTVDGVDVSDLAASVAGSTPLSPFLLMGA